MSRPAESSVACGISTRKETVGVMLDRFGNGLSACGYVKGASIVGNICVALQEDSYASGAEREREGPVLAL